jgi:apolipoprotein N-acyltransferase
MPGGGVAEGQRSGVPGAAQVGGPAAGGLGRLLQVETRGAIVAAIVGVAAFHLAYFATSFAGAMVVFLLAAVWVSRIRSPRGAFWLGLGMGFFVYGPHLLFFWKIFGPIAVSLWLILSVWVGFFALIAHYAAHRFPIAIAAALLPLLWTGFEYFRSECYPLKFAWLTPGLAFAPGEMAHVVGGYGIGFLCMALAAAAWMFRGWVRWLVAAMGVAAAAGLGRIPSGDRATGIDEPPGPIVVGIQREGAEPWKAVEWLEAARVKYPPAELFILSEYTFPDLPPDDVRAWCKAHGKYLLAGGVRNVEGPRNKFYDTAFVVGPTGEILFEQPKAVPIQFMQDGLPAPSQNLWQSPWGPIGVCVCYDLSYTRVVDQLVAKGARLLVVPAMDAASWGAAEHALHGRVGPMRAAEYGVPILRVCSSGISQIIDQTGTVVSSAEFPGQGDMVVGQVSLAHNKSLPWDRTLAPICALLTIGYSALELLLASIRRVRDGRGNKSRKPNASVATSPPSTPANQ